MGFISAGMSEIQAVMLRCLNIDLRARLASLKTFVMNISKISNLRGYVSYGRRDDLIAKEQMY